MKNLVVLSGAGISAESGLKTFRDSNGLWENHKIEDVATPTGWNNNPELVLEFYNQRRKQASLAKPNMAHKALARLENKFRVTIVTQNVDDLHEKGGSSVVYHLHGELNKARSTLDPNLTYKINDSNISMGDLCEKGYQLRPDIVWFGEPVPMIEKVITYFRSADILIVIGTSLSVYPASGLIDHVNSFADCYYIDPNANENTLRDDFTIIFKQASVGTKELVNILLRS